MTATDTLTEAGRRGVRLTPAVGSLELDGPPAALTRGFLADLKANKAGVLDLLKADRIGRALAALSPDDRERWEERAAIREFDGGFPRPQAEALALLDVTGPDRGA